MCLLSVELSYLSVIMCFNVFVVYRTLLSVCDVLMLWFTYMSLSSQCTPIRMIFYCTGVLCNSLAWMNQVGMMNIALD